MLPFPLWVLARNGPENELGKLVACPQGSISKAKLSRYNVPKVCMYVYTYVPLLKVLYTSSMITSSSSRLECQAKRASAYKMGWDGPNGVHTTTYLPNAVSHVGTLANGEPQNFWSQNVQS